MNGQKTPLTSGIKLKDKFGYALGDSAGVLLFSVIGAYLQMFYTDILYISLNKIIVLMFAARIWDAINDPIWGGIIDRRKPSKNGKFKPYLLWLSFPLAVAGVLTFTKIPGLSENQYLIYAYITYIFYGMMYTGTNIPYGALASVITDDEMERSSLSVYRSVGSGLGGLPGQILLPLFVYSTAVDTGAKYLDAGKLTVSVAILAGFCVIAYIFSYKLTVERVASPKIPQKTNAAETIKTLLKNKAFIVLCFASMLLISSTVYTQTLCNYLFRDYFSNPKLFSLYTIVLYAPMILLIPLMGKLVRKFGKKELCAVGMGLAAAGNILLWLLNTGNPYVFLAFCFVGGIGITPLILQVWALATDVIDYQEYIARKREEGITYAFFSFTRKVGQTAAGMLSVYALKLIGYDAKNITPGVISKMYTVSTAIPAFMYLAAFLFLAFLYPLSKAKLKSLHENEYKMRAEEVSAEV